MQIRMVPVEKLSPSAFNDPRRTTQGVIKGLAENLKVKGMMNPILVTESYEVGDGHRRLESAKLLGWKKVPVSVVPGSTAAEIFHSANSYSRKLTTKEAIFSYGVDPTTVSPQQFKRFSKMEQVLGTDLFNKIANYGLTDNVFATAKKLAAYCGKAKDVDFIRTTTHWLIDHRMTDRAKNAMVAGTKAAMIIKKIEADKPLSATFR